jgi:hypothetical protein
MSEGTGAKRVHWKTSAQENRRILWQMALERGWTPAPDGEPQLAGEFIVSHNGRCVIYHNGTNIDYWAPLEEDSNHVV